MRFAVAPIALSLAMLAAPAFAQNTGMSNDSSGHYGQSNPQYSSGEQQHGNQANNNYGSRGSNQFADQQNPGVTYSTQQKIRQSLEQNGFRNVQVTPEAFVIRAQAPDGSHIAMEVTPDMVQGVVENSGSNTNRNRNFSGNNGGQLNNNNNHSGSSTSGSDNSWNNDNSSATESGR